MNKNYVYVSNTFITEGSVKIKRDDILHLVKDPDGTNEIGIEIYDCDYKYDTYVASTVEKCIDRILEDESDVTSKTITTLTPSNVDKQMSDDYSVNVLKCGPDIWTGDDLFEDLVTYEDMLLVIDNCGYVLGRILKMKVN